MVAPRTFRKMVKLVTLPPRAIAPDSGQLFRLHGPAQREQHTELGLRGVEMLHLP